MAPREREVVRLDGEDESAMGRKPSLEANWMARWPRPLELCDVRG